MFYFEAFAGFSGQSVYNDWYMLIFNVLLTSLPVISLGAFEQDVSSEVCLQVMSTTLFHHAPFSTIFICLWYMQFPALYQQGPKNLFFDWYRIIGWMCNGLYCSLVIFFLNVFIFYLQPFDTNGQTADMSTIGTTMFTCIVWVVNCQIALTMSHFTWIQHAFVWGSIVSWYLFLVLYGYLSSDISGNAYKIFVEELSPSPIFWSTTLLVTLISNLPYIFHISFQRSFNPMDHHIIQEIKYYKKDVEDRRMWTSERSKARQKTKIGFTARVDAKIRQLKARLRKRDSISTPSTPVTTD